MRKHITLAIVLVAALGLAGTVPAAEEAAPKTLVKVDGFDVTNLHLALFANQLGRQPQDAQGQIRLLNELVNNVMVANSPAGRQLEQRADVTAALEVARARLIAQAFVQVELEKVEIDEQRVQAIYAADYAAAGEEYKARHILLESEDEARAVISDLDAGGDFDSLARERSTGPSKSVGGDLGWFDSQQMVPAFSVATQALANGSYSKTPVKTDFGWHVILREESREVAPPSLESVRSEIEQQLQREHVAKAINAIQAASKIEIQNGE